MAELTLDQKKVLALAAARLRLKQQQAQQANTQGNPDNWGMAPEASDMLTFGLQSKINALGGAAIDSLTGQGSGYWDNYDKRLQQQRGDQAAYGEQNPVKKRIGQGAGLAVGVATLPSINVIRGGGLLARTGNAALTGAGYGAASGAAQDANSVTERLMNTGVGAGLGAGMGAAAPVIARGVGATWGTVASWLSNRGIQSPAAVQKILTRLQATGMTPAQAQQRLNELGPEGMLADVNPGMQAATGATAAREPGAAAIVSQRLANRLEGAQQRIANDLNATMGPASDPYAQMGRNKAARSTVGPDYEKAISNAPPIPNNVRFQIADKLSNPRYNAREQDIVKRWLQQVDHAFDAPTAEGTAGQLQRIKFDLDAEIERDQMARFGMNSKQKAGQGILQDIRSAVDDALKTHVPGYREADAAFAPIARQQQAYEAGRKALRDNVSVGEHQANVQGYTPIENQMSRSGMRYDINQRLDRPRQNPGLTADRILGSNAAQQKLESSIGRNNADRLRRGIGREETFTETSNLADVRRGSRTAPLTEVGNEMWGSGRGLLGDVAASAVGGLVGGGLLGSGGAALGTIGRRLGSNAGSALNASAQRLIRDTADKLTLRGAQRDMFMQQLRQMAARLPQQQRTARNIETMATRLLVRSAGLLSPTIGRGLGLLSQPSQQ